MSNKFFYNQQTSNLYYIYLINAFFYSFFTVILENMTNENMKNNQLSND